VVTDLSSLWSSGQALLTQFENHFFTRNQLVAMDVKGTTLKFKVTDLELARLGNEDAAADVSAKHQASTVRGVLMKQTGIELVPVMGSALKLVTVSSGGGSSAVYVGPSISPTTPLHHRRAVAHPTVPTVCPRSSSPAGRSNRSASAASTTSCRTSSAAPLRHACFHAM
jgi:hypothetical protein